MYVYLMYKCLVECLHYTHSFKPLSLCKTKKKNLVLFIFSGKRYYLLKRSFIHKFFKIFSDTVWKNLTTG